MRTETRIGSPRRRRITGMRIAVCLCLAARLHAPNKGPSVRSAQRPAQSLEPTSLQIDCSSKMPRIACSP